MAVVQKNIDPKIDGQLWAATLFGMLAHLVARRKWINGKWYRLLYKYLCENPAGPRYWVGSTPKTYEHYIMIYVRENGRIFTQNQQHRLHHHHVQPGRADCKL